PLHCRLLLQRSRRTCGQARNNLRHWRLGHNPGGFRTWGGAGTATATPVTASTLVHRAPPGTVACPLTSGIFPISRGGLGPDVGWILRLLAAPGAEFVLPV